MNNLFLISLIAIMLTGCDTTSTWATPPTEMRQQASPAALNLYATADTAAMQETAVSQQQETANRHDLEKLQIRLAHKAELARIQRSASIVPAQSQHSANGASYPCPHCARSFASVQAVNAHQRFCAGKEAA